MELGPQNHKKDSLSYIGSTYGPSGIYLQQNLRNFVVYTFLLIIQAPQKKLLLSALIRCPGCVQTQRPEVCAQALSPKPPKYSKPYATKARTPNSEARAVSTQWMDGAILVAPILTNRSQYVPSSASLCREGFYEGFSTV